MIPPTQRLDHADSWRTSFDGTVLAHASLDGKASVVLDQSAFYPESGGQLFDTGRLGGQPVVNVQVDDAGVVHHVVEGSLPAVGTRVHGEIDRARRRLHMAHHTAQHMLSRALLDVAKGETVSSRLGGTACTIDLGLPRISDEELAAAVEQVNAAVDDDRPIRAFFPSEDELRALPLRRAPKVTHHIRVVEMEGFDVSPCGGTHCTRTGQVGLVRLLGWERYKGMVRVTFDAGKRARDSLLAEATALRTLATQFNCGVLEVVPSVEKLQRDITATREALGLSRARMAQGDAETLLGTARAAGLSCVVALFDDGDIEYLRAVVKRLTSHADVAALLACRTPEGLPMVCSRGDLSTFDCGAALKRVATEGKGRGGGKPNHAEGRLPPDANWATLTAWVTSG